MGNNRFQALKSLIKFDKPIKDVEDQLKAYSWDYSGKPYIVNASDIAQVLQKFLNKSITENERAIFK